MCGRYSFTSPQEAMQQLFDLVSPEMAARFNIAPSQSALMVHADAQAQTYKASMARWGLIPHWLNQANESSLLINARVETVAEKPAFRTAFAKQRCLVPADGFYEWQRRDKQSLPYRLYCADNRPFAFAGIFSESQAADGGDQLRFAILTTAADPAIAPIHARMPVILPQQLYRPWLFETGSTAAQALLATARQQGLPSHFQTQPISSYVNKAGNEGPDCWQAAAPAPASPAKAKQLDLF